MHTSKIGDGLKTNRRNRTMARRKFYEGDVVKVKSTGTEMTITGYGAVKGAKAYKGKVPATGKTLLIPETSLELVHRPTTATSM